jgi:hypothetical protein
MNNVPDLLPIIADFLHSSYEEFAKLGSIIAHAHRYQLKALILLRNMITTWKKELRAFSKTDDETLTNATVKALYLGFVAMTAATIALQKVRGPVGLLAKQVSVMLKQL